MQCFHFSQPHSTPDVAKVKPAPGVVPSPLSSTFIRIEIRQRARNWRELQRAKAPLADVPQLRQTPVSPQPLGARSSGVLALVI